jgi:N-formylglutamate deformylase
MVSATSPHPAYRLVVPAGDPAPVLVDSPHSGWQWPPEFTPAAPRDAVRTTWDAFVDELWGQAPQVGVTLLAATFPRAYIDANREPSDLDSALLAEPWPEPLQPTAYSARGMGLVRRLALPAVPMYSHPLSVAAVQHRLAHYYQPYRDALRAQLDALQARHGGVWHVNAHSMKSTGNAMNVDAGAQRPDVVVSDRHGTTASPACTAWVAEWFAAQGLHTTVNTPYQGGAIVVAEGRPAAHRHSVQVEFNRALYLHEDTGERRTSFADLQAVCTAFLRAFVAYAHTERRARVDADVRTDHTARP